MVAWFLYMYIKKMISVIIPYKKDRGWLNDAVASVKNQWYKDYQLLLAHGDRTQGANINEGLKLAKGEYIKILHDDDILPPNSLKDSLDGIQGYDFVCGDHQTFGDEIYCPNPVILEGCIPTLDRMIVCNQIGGGTMLYRKDVLLAVGGYDESLWAGEEYDLHLKLLSLGYKCNYVNKVVHNYRLHEKNKSYYMGPGTRKMRREYIRGIAKKYVYG